VDQQYHFNVIWFNRNDLTDWAQGFLNRRAQDKNWVLVYLDPYAVIFVRRAPSNMSVIMDHEIK
jgi:hypothetical protein